MYRYSNSRTASPAAFLRPQAAAAHLAGLLAKEISIMTSVSIAQEGRSISA